MTQSKEYIICPYCARPLSPSLMTGNTGLINSNGTEKQIICDSCGNVFDCRMDVKITYKAYKQR